jgi:choline dehydrogenase-like flavoprotein
MTGIRHGHDVAVPVREDVDVVVVGSGAGGANVALRLCELGVGRVLLLEAGGAWQPHEFSSEDAAAIPLLWDQFGLRAASGDTEFPIPGARALGGSTIINSGICFRAPQKVTDEWVHDRGIDWATQDILAPTFDWVWKTMEVRPTPDPYLGRHNHISAEAFAGMDWQWDWIPRNTPTCVGCGQCQYGCPSGGKRSVDRAQIPMGIALGLSVLTRARVDRVIVEKGRAVGVEGALMAKDAWTERGRLEVRAKIVVVAGGAIRTPMLLQASGLGGPDDGIGKGLHVHPALGVMGWFPEERVEVWKGATQGVYSDQFLDDGMLFESSNLPAAAFYGFMARAGMDPADVMKIYPHVAVAGAMLRDVGEGTVKNGPLGAAIEYHFAPRDMERFLRSQVLAGEAYFNRGAAGVVPLIHGAGMVHSMAELQAAIAKVRRPSDLMLYASHPQASVRMHADPARGPLSPDFSLHKVPNLFVADGSVFPDALGVNPQITIMAAARLAADRVVAKL